MSKIKLISSAVLGFTLVLAAGAGSASAAGPTPRGPVGGCGAGFELLTLAEIEKKYGRAPTSYDANLDGKVCLRLSPPPQTDSFVGIAVDNNAVGRR